jgi:hypothetical protein
LGKVDASFLQAFLATRHQAPFADGSFHVEEYPQKQSADSAQECRERRTFRLFRPLAEKTPDGRTAWDEFEHYTIMLCQKGPLAPGNVQTTIDTAMRMLRPPGVKLPAEAEEFARQASGYSFQIGERTGRAAVLFDVGHGILFDPIAVIQSADASATLCVVLDDPHFGERGHEATQALTDLVDLLEAVDPRTRPPAR